MLGSRRAVAAVVMLVLWGFITHGSYGGTGDEPHYLIIAHSLAFDRDVDLANNYADRTIFGADFEAGAHARPGKDGRLRPVHDIGLPVLFAPVYAGAHLVAQWTARTAPPSWLNRARLTTTTLRRQILSLAMSALTAWIAVALFEVFTAAGGPRRRAGLWVVLLVLSPPLLSHAALFFTEILMALIALQVLLVLRRPVVSRPAALAAGAAVGYLLIVHARSAGLVASLFLLAAWRLTASRQIDALRWFVAACAVMFAARTAIVFHFWGALFTTPMAHPVAVSGVTAVAAETGVRLLGWLFDQEHGLLWYAPIYLLVPAGWIALWRRERRLAAELAFVVASYVGLLALPFVNGHGWRGGWSPAARFLVPITPLLAVVVYAAVAAASRTPAFIRALAAVQIVLSAFFWQHPRLLWNDGDGVSALLAYLDGGTGRLSPYLPVLDPRPGAPALLAMAAAVVAWLLVSAAAARHRPPVDAVQAAIR